MGGLGFAVAVASASVKRGTELADADKVIRKAMAPVLKTRIFLGLF